MEWPAEGPKLFSTHSLSSSSQGKLMVLFYCYFLWLGRPQAPSSDKNNNNNNNSLRSVHWPGRAVFYGRCLYREPHGLS